MMGKTTLLICLLFVLMQKAATDLLIDASTSKINLETRSPLDINCTFSLKTHPEMAVLISVVLSRANATGHSFQDLASITQFTPDTVTVLTEEKVTATGVHSQTGESFLHVSWEHPTCLQGGIYKCSALGVNMIGRYVALTNTSSVIIDQANLKDLFEKLGQMKTRDLSMEDTISTMRNQIQGLEYTGASLEHDIQIMKNHTTSMNNEIEALLNNLTSMDNQIESLENDTTSMENQIQTLQNDTTSIDNQIEALQNDSTSMDNKIESLQNDTTSMENQILSLQNDATQTENQIHTLQNDAASTENQIQTLESEKASLENQIQSLQIDKASMESDIQNLKKDISHLESTVPLLQKVANWIPLGKHEDHYYYVSTENYGDVDNAISACISFGGELAVMNDQDEYTAVKGFLGYTSGFAHIVIAGSDEDTEGKWVLPNSNTPLPFTAWTSFAVRGNTEKYNCLTLESDYSWLMNGVTCHGSPTDGYRYMCELSNL